MKKVIAFLRSSVSNSRNDLEKVEIELRDLRRRVVYINANPNKVKAMVELIKVLSSLEEKNTFNGVIASLKKKNYGQLEEVLDAFQELESHLRDARRGKFGHNRAEADMRVSADNIYLGGVLGLEMQTASYWLKNRRAEDKIYKTNIGIPGNQSVSNWWLVNNHLAGNYVKSSMEGIVKNVDIINRFF